MNPLQHLNRATTAALLLGALCLLLAMGQLMAWGLDRRVPFHLVSYAAEPTLPGDTLIVRATVERDLARHCSVIYSRMFHDSSGARFDITAGAQAMNADALDDLNRRTPDALVLSITVPPMASPGIGALVTSLDYVCNPMHQLYPVSVLMMIDVEVL